MGTSVNWPEAVDARIKEGADAIVGVVLAVATAPVPVKIARALLREAPHPDALWERLQAEHGLPATSPGIYLAPAGWTVAELYPATAASTADGEFPDAKPLASTSAEDFPPGRALDVVGLPEEFWLAAHYA
jgi:hypothetical protein